MEVPSWTLNQNNNQRLDEWVWQEGEIWVFFFAEEKNDFDDTFWLRSYVVDTGCAEMEELPLNWIVAG